jgi:hypothetical protein
MKIIVGELMSVACGKDRHADCMGKTATRPGPPIGQGQRHSGGGGQIVRCACRCHDNASYVTRGGRVVTYRMA